MSCEKPIILNIPDISPVVHQQVGIMIFRASLQCMGILGGSDGKASACSAGDLGSIPELERSPGEGNGNPLQYSCLEDSTDRGAS